MNRAAVRFDVALAGALLAAACGGRSADRPAPPPPDLTGARVMVVPAPVGAPDGLDAELAYWLGEHSPATDWIAQDELQAAVDRAIAWRVRLDAMPRRIADGDRRAPYLVDPTYGELRRLGALMDANLALLPLAVARTGEGDTMTLELAAAIVDVRGGQVLWLGGATIPLADDARARPAAELAEALARTLFPR